MRHTKTHMLGPKDAWKEKENINALFLSFLFNLIYAFLGHRSIVLTLDEKHPFDGIHAERENSELCSLNYPRLGEQVLILKKMTEPDLVLQSPLPLARPKAQQEISGTVQPPRGPGLALFQKIRKSSINHRTIGISTW